VGRTIRRLSIGGLAAGVLVLLAPMQAGATLINLGANINGAQETPPVVTAGHGAATITYDDVTNQLNWTIYYEALTGTTTDAHFHGPAGPGVPAAVQIPIPHTNGVTSDTLVGSAVLTATQETQLLSGLWYINIHSTFRPGGEIRGQVVPEPTTLLLLGSGLALLAARRSQA
jgi:hypothetical protein